MTNIVAKKTIFFTIKTSLFRPATSADVYSFKFVEHTHEKRGASSVPGPRFEGLRITLSVQPSNAESPTLMYVMTHYIIMCTNTTPPRGVPVALFLTDKWKLRSSQSVKPKAFRKRLCMYVSHLTDYPRGFQHW